MIRCLAYVMTGWLLAAGFAPVGAAVVNVHPIADESLANDTFRVQVQLVGDKAWREVPAYNAKVRCDRYEQCDASVALFEADAPVRVRVSKKDGSIKRAVVRPLRIGIETEKVDERTIEFLMKEPAYLSVEMDGDIYRNLHLFADRPEDNPLTKSAPDVLYFGPGLHVMKKPVVLRDNQTLYLAAGACLLFDEHVADDPGDGSSPELFRKFPGTCILAHNRKNVTIRGRGIIAMTGSAFSDQGGNTGNKNANIISHRGIMFANCSNVVVDGITFLKASRGWPNSIAHSKNVTYRNFKEIGGAMNTDGIDINASSDVVVSHAFIRSGDDSITVKSFGGNNRNLLFTDLSVWNDEANHPLIVGGESKGDLFENIVFRDIDILRFNSPGCLGGAMTVSVNDDATIRNVRFEDIRVESIRGRNSCLMKLQIVYNERWTRTPPGEGFRGHIEDVVFKDIESLVEKKSIFKGYDRAHAINGVALEHIRINGREKKSAEAMGLTIRPFVENVYFR